MHATIRQGILTCAMALSAENVAFAINDAFNVRTLPKGKEVTLPRPAVTMVPLTERVQVSSTDMPQTLKLSNLHGAKPFTVAIYDSQATKVKRVELKPGMTYLYSFQDLNTIALVPEGLPSSSEQLLRLESNKPLGLSR